MVFNKKRQNDHLLLKCIWNSQNSQKLSFLDVLEFGPFSSKRWYFGKMVKWSYSVKCVWNWQNKQKWQSLRLERWSGLNVLNFDRCQPQEKPLTARIQMKLNPQYVSVFQPYSQAVAASSFSEAETIRFRNPTFETFGSSLFWIHRI